MCNPRKVRVRASRRLARAWHAEITRTAQASETLTGQARIIEQFGAGLAPMVRKRFEEHLAADPRWHRTDDGFRHDLPGGYLVYQPDTGEVEIVATVTGEFTARGQASRSASGVAEAEAEVEVEESYYSDGYGGNNKAAAEKRGRAIAVKAAENQARQQVAAQRAADQAAAQQALTSQSGDVEAAALVDAQQQLRDDRAGREEELTTKAQQRLQRLHDDYLEPLTGPLANAYRDILLERAQQPDVSDLYFDEHDGVIEIQFLMEA